MDRGPHIATETHDRQLPAPMPLDAEFLAILVCPRRRLPLRQADAQELARWNARIAAGEVRNAGGDAVTEPLAEALVVCPPAGEQSAETVVYPIRDGIPVLLEQEAITITT